MHYLYSVADDLCDTKHRFNTNFETTSLWMVAEEAAQDYHSNHDGWESNWPRTFRLYSEDGKHLGDFEVDMEMEPKFEAWKSRKTFCDGCVTTATDPGKFCSGHKPAKQGVPDGKVGG